MPSEFDIIARYFAPLAGEGAFGLLDDAAVFKPTAGNELVITTDAIVAGVHFFANDPADTIARKALGVNLSDLAAKGARPRGFLLTLMLPRKVEDVVSGEWLAAFSTALGQLAAESGCALLGGDTVSTSGPLALSITGFGEVPSGSMVQRSKAQAGDHLFVTGTIGDAAIGLQLRLADIAGTHWPLAPDHLSHLRERYQVPRPRTVLAEIVRKHAHAAMDISDGFVGDLTKMVRLSGNGAEVFLADVPLSVAARAAIRMKPDLRDTAFTGGDDYEILASVPSAKAKAFQAACLAAGVGVTLVGLVQTAPAPVRFIEADGTERSFARGSYVHG
ncbi:MAG: thiamine-phosphate kinase [Beijerinckiaceae bacterium]